MYLAKMLEPAIDASIKSLKMGGCEDKTQICRWL